MPTMNKAAKNKAQMQFAQMTKTLLPMIRRRIQNVKNAPMNDVDFNQLDHMGSLIANQQVTTARELLDAMSEYTTMRDQGEFTVDRFKELVALAKGGTSEGMIEAHAKATCGCDASSCSHCGGKHTLDEVGKTCDCCENKIKKVETTNEGLADMAGVAERDHEVQMARAELYKIAKYAIKLHEMLKGVSEAEGIEGWMQSKITKAADYMGSVYHTLDYDMMGESKKTFKGNMDEAAKADYKTTLAEKMKEQTCNECSKTMLTAQEKKELANLPEGKRHGNSKIYQKCWKGCRKVAGVPRGQPGSCKCD